MEAHVVKRSKIDCLEPFVISGRIDDWKAIRWTHEQLAQIVKPTEKNGFLRIRLGPKEHVRGKVSLNPFDLCIINVVVVKVAK